MVGGIYRFVRNPMYVGVTAMIGGQALLFRSPGTALWAVVFLATTARFVSLYEQPQLQQQFGESYERYRQGGAGLVAAAHALPGLSYLATEPVASLTLARSGRVRESGPAKIL